MARISSYPTTTPTGSDLIIGTDVSTTPNSTKTFTIDSINELATGTPAVGTLNTLALFTSAAAVGNSSIIRSGAGATSVYTFGAGTTISNTAITTANLTTTGNTILGNAGTDTLTINAASTFADDLTILTGNFFTCSAGATFQAPLTVNSTSAFAQDATFSGNLSLLDDKIIKVGTSNDLQIFHTSTNTGSFIQESGPGSLEIYSDTGVNIKSGALGENFAKFTKDGPIELYYDNVKKLSTVSSGVSIDNGGLTVQGSAGNNGNVTLAGTGVVNGVTSVKLAAGSVDKVTVTSTKITIASAIIPSYANNTAALAAGLTAGDLYRNGDSLNIVH